jgi:hypothetical protein
MRCSGPRWRVPVTSAEDLIALPDQAEDQQAKLMAMTKLALLYPDTFKILLLAAREALRPMSVEVRLDGHSRASLVPWEP